MELFVFIMLASLALIVSDFQAVRTASRIAEAAEIPYVKININGFVRYPAAALTNNSEVFLTQGIVDLASSESEIAAVIAHEVAHDLNTGILCNLRTLFFTRKDVLFGFLLSCSISIKIGLAVLFAIMAIQVTLRWLVGMAYRNELNRVGQVCFLILFGVNAIQGWVCIALLIICFGLRSFNPAELIGEFVITLTYLGWAVKEEEYKADRIAVGLIAKAGYDPNGFVTMFSKFPKEKISWLARHYKSRHPTTLSRINRIRREIKRKYS